ncbi:putative methyltransferase DDB_G0268948 [Glandiceps talaboti]
MAATLEAPREAYTDFFKGSEMAGDYKNLRPSYPQDVAKRIVSYAKQKLGELKLAVDVGCGSGQSTIILADDVEKVLGVDISEDQIEFAKNSTAPPNVDFKVGSCGDIPVESETVDLITVGTAIHWFDMAEFYKEVERILRPGGCLAIYTYYSTKLEDSDNEKSKQMNDLLKKFEEKVMNKNRREGQWAKILDGEDTFRELQLPYKDSERDTSLAIKNDQSVASVIALMKTYSECKEYLRKNPDDGDKVFDELQTSIIEILESKTSAENTIVTCVLPLYLSMARKPE